MGMALVIWCGVLGYSVDYYGWHLITGTPVTWKEIFTGTPPTTVASSASGTSAAAKKAQTAKLDAAATAVAKKNSGLSGIFGDFGF